LAVAAVLVAMACLLLAQPAEAARRSHDRPLVRQWRGYGFLPGYRPPDQIARERRQARGPWTYAVYPWARFYRGQWNGGSFGPCWTRTPIGMVWNCGR